MKKLMFMALLTGGGLAEPSTLFVSQGPWVECKEAGARVRLLDIKSGQATLEVAQGDKTRKGRYGTGEKVPVGDYLFWLESLEPDRKVPLVIKPRLAPPADRAVEFLKGFGWHPETAFQSIAEQLPARLGGLPWVHYQGACERVGMDLNLASGQKITIRKYRLAEKTPRKFTVYAYLAVAGQRLVGGWLAPDGDAAPGIYSLDTKGF